MADLAQSEPSSTVLVRTPGPLSRTTINILLACYLVLGSAIGIAAGYFWKSAHLNGPDEYHHWLYQRFEQTMYNNWLGVTVEKYPQDLWIYQEIITETRPDVLVEAGTFRGGSAFYFASIFDYLNHGRVLTIDVIKFPNLPQHPRITYLLGSSTSDPIFQQIKNSIRSGEHVMVSLDSDHHAAHVLEELKLYSQLVTVGDYLVVEDTEINGHPVYPSFGAGPTEALEEFLKTNHDFIQDRSREKFAVTSEPGGWLKRVH